MNIDDIFSELDEIETLDGPQNLLSWLEFLEPNYQSLSFNQRALIAARISRLAPGSNQYKVKYKKLGEI